MENAPDGIVTAGICKNSALASLIPTLQLLEEHDWYRLATFPVFELFPENPAVGCDTEVTGVAELINAPN